jgi:hypothetical protein
MVSAYLVVVRTRDESEPDSIGEEDIVDAMESLSSEEHVQDLAVIPFTHVSQVLGIEVAWDHH